MGVLLEVTSFSDIQSTIEVELLRIIVSTAHRTGGTLSRDCVEFNRNMYKDTDVK